MTVVAVRLLVLGVLGLVRLVASASGSAQEPPSAGKDAPASLVAVPSGVPADGRRYAVLLAGNRAGILAAWVTPDGAHHSFFAFNDRGRGPSVTTRVVLDRSGIITELDATGSDYLKAPVNEHFRIAGGKASWSSEAEKGEKNLTGPALYAPISGTLTDETEAALLAAPGHRLPLLPEGEAAIERVAERTVDVGGHPAKAILYEETGFGFTPGAVWLD
jgi:hypothetical protein